MLFSLLLPLLGIFMPGFSAEVPCLDPLACNFMEEGECYFTDENGDPCVIEGCTIEGACNYNPEADIYDGSCEFVSCLGCTDSEACNYDETALYDDATCIYYVDCNGTCGGDWVEDACGNCYELYDEVDWEHTFTTCSATGSMGPSQADCDAAYGSNFVVSNNGIQEFLVPFTGTYLIEAIGAGQANAQGAKISAELYFFQGDLLRILIGQNGDIEHACGHGGTFLAAADNTPLLIAGGGAGIGSSQYVNALSNASIATCGNNGNLGFGGCDGEGGDASEANHDLGGGGGGGFFSDGEDEGSNYAAGGQAFVNGGLGGIYNGYEYSEGGFGGGGAGYYSEEPAGGGGYSGGGGGGCNCDGGIYPGENRWAGGGGSFISALSENVESIENFNAGPGILSLTLLDRELPPLCNPGCTYPQACNYNPESNFDDGSCDYCFCGEGTQWVDSLQACMITEEALMQACGEGTYWDDLAQACLTIETCQEDLDGDGVIGVNDLLELLSSFGSECVVEPETAEWTCGDPINYHGYDYNTVLIGGQCWFAENLRTQNYSNGDAINTGLNGPEWANATSGAVTLYGEDPSPSCVDYSPTVDSCDPNEALPAFGRIYNWHAVGDPRGLCPAGWHVPSDNDFMALEVFMGIDANEVQASGWRGTTEGDQLKTDTGWHNGGNGTNLYGFDLRPAGARGTSGQYDNAGRNGYLWTSTSPQENSAFYRRIEAGNSQIARGSYVYVEGYPARCIKD